MRDIVALLDRLGVDHQVHHHPPVLTVEEAREYWSSIAAVHTKNLLLKDEGGRYWMVCTPADKLLDLKTLPAKIGSKRLRFAPADQLSELLGIGPGAVSAFAMIYDERKRVSLVLDAVLMASDRIAFHPLDNRRTVVIAPAGLLVFLSSIGRTPIDVAL